MPSQPSLISWPAPGYWRTKRTIARLERFKNLIIHLERWAGDVDAAPSLAELFPGENVTVGTVAAIQRIEQEIRQLAPVVLWDLRWPRIPTTAWFGSLMSAGDKRREYNVITDYFRLPRAQHAQACYEAVIEVLDNGIGVYKTRLHQAKRDMVNPIVWIASVVRLPITIMEHAGLATSEEGQRMALGVWGKIVRALWVVFLVLGAIHYGVKVPWSDIVTKLITEFSR